MLLCLCECVHANVLLTEMLDGRICDNEQGGIGERPVSGLWFEHT